TFTLGSRLRETISALNASDHRRRCATGAPSIRSGTASIRWKLLSPGIVADIEYDTHHKHWNVDNAHRQPSPDGMGLAVTEQPWPGCVNSAAGRASPWPLQAAHIP